MMLGCPPDLHVKESVTRTAAARDGQAPRSMCYAGEVLALSCATQEPVTQTSRAIFLEQCIYLRRPHPEQSRAGRSKVR